MMASATLTSLRRAVKATMILGTLMTVFNKTTIKLKLPLISLQISLLYLSNLPDL